MGSFALAVPGGDHHQWPPTCPPHLGGANRSSFPDVATGGQPFRQRPRRHPSNRLPAGLESASFASLAGIPPGTGSRRLKTLAGLAGRRVVGPTGRLPKLASAQMDRGMDRFGPIRLKPEPWRLACPTGVALQKGRGLARLGGVTGRAVGPRRSLVSIALSTRRPNVAGRHGTAET